MPNPDLFWHFEGTLRKSGWQQKEVQQEWEADRFAADFWATNDTKAAQAAAAAFLSRAVDEL